ncbi:MAG TPA: hypothetical protein VJX23_02725 [Candidatus Binataceae bacterium]|nr:hypothetical protein [Candidatus Binataceae bacterium]
MPHESRLSFSTEEILANVPTTEALIVKGVRCHGGFDADGGYRSPRTLWRVPAVKAWQDQHLRTSPVPLVEVPEDAIPPHAISVAQAKFLLREGVREPIVRLLSEIAIVEGFGAMIRELPVPPLKSFIREDVAGTALEHLTGGLFEAHARDEAGWEQEGGHRQMWDAARDAALSNPHISPEIFANIMARRGQEPAALFPELGAPVERLVRFMVNVLAIEVFARSTFAWAEEVLSDPTVSDAPKEAADLVRFIRSDEAPHVEYLRTALSEIAARTLYGREGKEFSGKEIADKLADRGLRAMIRQRMNERPASLRDLIRRTAKRDDIEELIAQYDTLATPWTPPARYYDPAPAPAPQGY